MGQRFWRRFHTKVNYQGAAAARIGRCGNEFKVPGVFDGLAGEVNPTRASDHANIQRKDGS